MLQDQSYDDLKEMQVNTVEQKVGKKFHNLALQWNVHISFSQTNKQQKHTRMHFHYFNF